MNELLADVVLLVVATTLLVGVPRYRRARGRKAALERATTRSADAAGSPRATTRKD